MKKHLTKIITFLLAACMLVTLAACSNGDSNNNSNNGNESNNNSGEVAGDGRRVVTTASVMAPQTLSPFVFYSLHGAGDKVLYERLIVFDGNGGATGVIAKDWSTEDGINYDIEIYDYVYDSAGNHITSEDIVFCFEQNIAAGNDLKAVSCVATGEFTVRLTVNANMVGSFDDAIDYCPIVSKAAYEASEDGMSTNPITTSPYIVSDYVANSYITLVRNENYWQKDESLYGPYAQGTVDEITFTCIKESAQTTIALETGTVTMAGVDATEIENFLEGGRDYGNFTVWESGNTGGQYLWFSGDPNSVVSDINLRKAIAYAIDKEMIVDGAYAGLAIPFTSMASPYQKLAPTVDTDDYFTYDLELAKQYLAASNYNGETIRLLAYSADAETKIMTIMQNCLQQLGVNVDLGIYEAALFHSYFYDPTKFDVALCFTGNNYVGATWSNFLTFSSGDGSHTVHGWDDAKLDALINECNIPENYSVESLNSVQEYINEQCYVVGLVSYPSYTVVRNDSHIIDSTFITDVSRNPVGLIFDN